MTTLRIDAGTHKNKNAQIDLEIFSAKAKMKMNSFFSFLLCVCVYVKYSVSCFVMREFDWPISECRRAQLQRIY